MFFQLLTTLLLNFRIIFIPASTSDIPFVHSEAEIAEMALRCSDYFNSQVADGNLVDIIVTKPVVLDGNISRYATDSHERQDKGFLTAFGECCRKTDSSTDFSTADGIFILMSGQSGHGDSHIWPHYQEFPEEPVRLDGKSFYNYSTCTESDGIGVICHEIAHLMGCPDLYDTDSEGSGGLSKSLGGINSLMDHGYLNDNGNTPPCLNAVEKECIGLVPEIKVKEGFVSLSPIGQGNPFARIDTGDENVYYLLECRRKEGYDSFIGGDGLLIYRVDKSGNNAGFSDSEGRTVSARERWEINEINCRPGFECVKLITPHSFPIEPYDLFFPCGTNSSCTVPDTGLLLENITLHSNGEISFIAVSPIEIISIDAFQSDAIIQWRTLSDVNDCSVIINNKFYPGSRFAPNSFSVRLDGLEPGREYSADIHFLGFVRTIYFKTKTFNSAIAPYIYLSGAERNADGSFPKGSRIPLVVFNSCGATEISWFVGGDEALPDADGYLILDKDCVLEARVSWKDGSRDIITKYITVR